MKTFKLFAFLTVILFSALAGCQDEITLADLSQSPGYIKGTLKGKSNDGKRLDESFHFASSFVPGSATYTEDKEGNTYIQIHLTDLDNFTSAYVSFRLSPTEKVTSCTIEIEVNTTLSSNEFLIYQAYASDTEALSDVSFDKDSGKVTGKFEFDEGYADNEATVEGEFSVKLYEAIN